jgi:hypothetical protein
MLNPNGSSFRAPGTKKDADYVFYELTRSICPVCRVVIDAQILIRDNKVYMRKRCSQHGLFEALVYGDAGMYTNSSKFNKPGTIPLKFRRNAIAAARSIVDCVRTINSTPA